VKRGRLFNRRAANGEVGRDGGKQRRRSSIGKLCRRAVHLCLFAQAARVLRRMVDAPTFCA
jgi:hypothetical protein